MARRSPARFLAPLALLAAVAAVGLVVSSTTDEGGTSSTRASTGAERGGSTSARTQTVKTATTSSGEAKSYTVKSGDTLGVIAEKTGVSVVELQELNPTLDPQSLSVGQRIRLRR